MELQPQERVLFEPMRGTAVRVTFKGLEDYVRLAAGRVVNLSIMIEDRPRIGIHWKCKTLKLQRNTSCIIDYTFMYDLHAS